MGNPTVVTSRQNSLLERAVLRRLIIARSYATGARIGILSCVYWLGCGQIVHGAKQTGSPFYISEHEAFREMARRFLAKEIEPYAHQWDEEGGFPRQLYQKAADIGLLGRVFRKNMLRLADNIGLARDFGPNVAAYWGRLQQRDGFKRAVAAERKAGVEQNVAPRVRN
jgi:alkylation response protein AidB-like acyl-CoA dehydrogenase